MPKRICSYSDDDDHQLVLEANLAEIGVKISACTVANSEGKPNEDAFSF